MSRAERALSRLSQMILLQESLSSTRARSPSQRSPLLSHLRSRCTSCPSTVDTFHVQHAPLCFTSLCLEQIPIVILDTHTHTHTCSLSYYFTSALTQHLVVFCIHFLVTTRHIRRDLSAGGDFYPVDVAWSFDNLSAAIAAGITPTQGTVRFFTGQVSQVNEPQKHVRMHTHACSRTCILTRSTYIHMLASCITCAHAQCRSHTTHQRASIQSSPFSPPFFCSHFVTPSRTPAALL